MNWFSSLIEFMFGVGGIERPSPQDFVPQKNIIIHPDRIEILLLNLNVSLTAPPKAWAPFIANTGSMDAVSDFGNNNLYIKGATPEDHQRLIDYLKTGDVAAYKMEDGAFISHRIYKIGQDNKGRYFRFLGDNNANKLDPYVVRDKNIEWISIGVIY